MFDVQSLRRQFPALQQTRDGPTPIFLDGPGGTQVPQRVIDAMTDYLRRCNANHGGLFASSQESDRILYRAHEAMADLLNAPAPEEIIFGANMTTLTLHLSRALGRTLKPGDEVIVTRLDHDANVTPWTLMARDAGAVVRTCDIRPEDCTLDLDDLGRLLGPRTRLLALAGASNAVGTINDVRAVAAWAHEVGAWVFVDAVHYTPHGPVDVQDWGCDFLACSAYKFFGPHVGVLWGRRQLLEELTPYKLRPVPETLPDRWMTGTQNHEGLAGVAAAVDYLADLGECPASGAASASRGGASEHSGLTLRRSPERRRQIHQGMVAIKVYEVGLGQRLLDGLANRPRFRVWGITEPGKFSWRVPTISITTEGRSVEDLARHLAGQQIYVWNGNMYALGLTERLGLERTGGLLRMGLVHYNTAEEVDAVLRALDSF
jgi:cysteine desulfurase family protein (TIGR01976 family)